MNRRGGMEVEYCSNYRKRGRIANIREERIEEKKRGEERKRGK